MAAFLDNDDGGGDGGGVVSRLSWLSKSCRFKGGGFGMCATGVTKGNAKVLMYCRTLTFDL